MSSPSSGEQVAWLKVILALATMLALVLLYVLLDDGSDGNSWLKLLDNVIPNLIAGLVVVVALYFIFTRQGISNSEEIAQEIKKAMPTAVASNSDLEGRGVRDFYPNFREVPWKELIEGSKSIDIVVCYFDSWVRANWDDLRDFFGKGGSLRLFLPDFEDDAAMRVVQERFPEHSVAVVKQKVVSTALRLGRVLEESGSKSARLEIHFHPSALNYSAVRFDGETVLLSVYEQFRKQKIDSSAILLDLNKSEHLRLYWDKEFGGFQEAARVESLSSLQQKSEAGFDGKP